MMMGVSSFCAITCAAACLELIEVPPLYALCVAECYAQFCGDPPVDFLAADQPITLTDKDFTGDCSCRISEPAFHQTVPLVGK